MSLEQAVLELAAAIREGHALMKPSGSVTTMSGDSTVVNKLAKPTKTAKAVEPEAAVEGPTYNDVKTAAGKLSEVKGREGVLAMFKKFGVENGTGLKQEQYAKFIESINTELLM